MTDFPMFTAQSMETEVKNARVAMENHWTDNNRWHARYLNPYQVVRDDWLAGQFLDANGQLDDHFPPLFAQAAQADADHWDAVREPDPENPTMGGPEEGTTLNDGRDQAEAWIEYLDPIILGGIGASSGQEYELAVSYWDEFVPAHHQAEYWVDFCEGRLNLADDAAADLDQAYRAMATYLIIQFPWYELPYDPWNDPSPYEQPQQEGQQ